MLDKTLTLLFLQESRNLNSPLSEQLLELLMLARSELLFLQDLVSILHIKISFIFAGLEKGGILVLVRLSESDCLFEGFVGELLFLSLDLLRLWGLLFLFFLGFFNFFVLSCGKFGSVLFILVELCLLFCSK